MGFEASFGQKGGLGATLFEINALFTWIGLVFIGGFKEYNKLGLRGLLHRKCMSDNNQISTLI